MRLALGEIETAAAEAVGDLLLVCRHPDRGVRFAAVWAVEQIEVPHPEAEGVLVGRLNDPAAVVRMHAIGALSRLTSLNEAVRLRLVELSTSDPENMVRAPAARSVGTPYEPATPSEPQPPEGFMNKYPRNFWPSACFPAQEWWKDKHVSALMRAEVALQQQVPTPLGAPSLPDREIELLVRMALDGELHPATAAMAPLYDAYDSFEVTISFFEAAFERGDDDRRQRSAGCLAFLLDHGRNRRPVRNRDADEVEADKQHFVRLLERGAALNRLLREPLDNKCFEPRVR